MQPNIWIHQDKIQPFYEGEKTLNENNFVKIHFSESTMRLLNEISKKENQPVDEMIRNLVERQIKLYEMRDAAQRYLSGELCVADAARLVNISVFDMMEFIKKEQYKQPIFSRDETSDSPQAIDFNKA